MRASRAAAQAKAPASAALSDAEQLDDESLAALGSGGGAGAGYASSHRAEESASLLGATPAPPLPAAQHSTFARARERLRLAEAALCLVAVAVIWVGASVLVQRMMADVHAQLPFFLTYVCVSEFVVLLPLRYAQETLLSRGAACGGLFSLAPTKPTDWRAAARAALLVCPLWFAAQGLYNASLGGTSVSSSTVLSTTSCVWTFVLSVALLRERFSWRRLGGVLATVAGAALVSFGDVQPSGGGGGGSGPGATTWWGDGLALLSALCYALYTTAIRVLVPHDGSVSLAVFFGCLGAFNSVLMLPLVGALAWSGVEPVWVVTPSFVGWVLAKGLLDNVLSDVLWGHAVLLSSPTLATTGLALTIPLAMAAELAMGGRLPSPLMAAGSALVVGGFLAVTLLSEAEPGGGGGTGEPPRGAGADRRSEQRDGGAAAVPASAVPARPLGGANLSPPAAG